MTNIFSFWLPTATCNTPDKCIYKGMSLILPKIVASHKTSIGFVPIATITSNNEGIGLSIEIVLFSLYGLGF